MVKEYGRQRTIQANCPTRWSIVHLICVDVLNNKQALKAAVVSDEWDEASGSSTNSARFKEIVFRTRGTNFWEELDLAIQVGKPIADAIHRIEGDTPLLSQALPIRTALEEHMVKFQLAHPQAKFRGLSGLVSQRFEKHWNNSVYAAHALDPMYA
eukprot:268674-Chlamydomonas_euryale.AAC.1